MVSEIERHIGVYTDLYQLSMAQGYYFAQKHRQAAVFEYYFRKLPFDGGYAVLAGVDTLLHLITDFQFSAESLDYLAAQGFKPEFLAYLKDFRLTGTLHCVSEGSLVFPYEPIAQYVGPLLEGQLLETVLLNILNFETLIATKAQRICQVAQGRRVLEFGLRRAQGFGGLQATKAAYIGGVTATSNVLAGMAHNIPVSGTHAHAWVMAFPDELSAFRAYAAQYPDSTTLLVDTFNTLESGVPNAIQVARELEARGHRLKGIRLDSGDLAYLSQRARHMLNEAGLDYVQIVASNDLDEYIIETLQYQGAAIDAYGVGTNLVTARDCPALGGVYKLIEIEGEPRIKISENVAKITLPGRKSLYRYTDPQTGQFVIDGVSLHAEPVPGHLKHPFLPFKETAVAGLKAEPLLEPVFQGGRPLIQPADLATVREHVQHQMTHLAEEHKRLKNPHTYRVGISDGLATLRDELMKQALQR
jgi:nicotinate phosphoribosyltransferase